MTHHKQTKQQPLLFWSLVPFWSIRQRPQQLALALAQHIPITYIPPHQSLLGKWRRSWHVETPHQSTVPLQMFEPVAALPASGYLPWLNDLNHSRTVARLRRHLAQQGLWPPLGQYVSFPKSLAVVRHLPVRPVIYDVVDDYSLFYDAWQGSVLARLHRQLLLQADLVIASSQTLADRCLALRGDCTTRWQKIPVLNNGVTDDFFTACQNPNTSIPKDLQALPQPRFGYVGSIARWFDFAAISELAKSYPAGSVVLIGPSDLKVPPLPPNVHLFGPRPYEQLPAYLRGFDLGLIPFLRCQEIDAVNPVKIYEYFAAGLPVLATRFKEMNVFADLITFCDNPADWPRQARLRLQKGWSTGHRQQQQRIAKENTWSQKAAQFMEWCHDLAPDRLHPARTTATMELERLEAA